MTLPYFWLGKEAEAESPLLAPGAVDPWYEKEFWEWYSRCEKEKIAAKLFGDAFNRD